MSHQKPFFAQAVKLHERAVHGDKQAVKQAYELFKNLVQLDPQDRLAQAYLGSTTSLLGRDALDPIERHNYATKGLKLLDEVVVKEPHNLEIQSLRAYVCFNLPEPFFHRTVTAIEDFKHLASRYEQDKNSLTEKFYHQVLFDLGVAYKRLNRLDEAKATWNKLLQVTTNPKYRKLVSQEGL